MLAIIASQRQNELRPFLDALKGEGIETLCAKSAAEALDLARGARPQLLIADQGLPDMAPLDLAARALHVDAFINTAVVSELPDEEFHEKSEGLGVLAQLPLSPGPDDAKRLAGSLKGLNT